MDLMLRAQSSVSENTKDSLYLLDLHVQESATNLVGRLVAASLSDFTVGIFLYENVKHVGTIRGHAGVITGLQFSRKDPFFLLTSSLDGTVRCWDLRTDCLEATSILKGTEQNKFTSLSVNNDGMLAAAGTEVEVVDKENESCVVFWDLRTSGCVGSYSESHTDDITQLKFHPIKDNLLASGSTDGLVCVYDLNSVSEDDGLFSTMNTESSVHRLGWYSASNIYAVTHMESVLGWEAMEAEPLFGTKPVAESEIRIPAASSAGGETTGIGQGTACIEVSPDYVADCFFDPENPTVPLCIVGKKGSGCASIMRLSKDGFNDSSMAHFPAAHSDSIRSCALDASSRSLLTGGEDSKMCLWQFQRMSRTENDDYSINDSMES